MSTEGGEGGAGDRSMLGWLPVAWVCIVMALAARGIDGSLASIWSYAFPGSVLAFIYGSMAVGVVTIGWGLWLLWLVYQRSPRFARQFTLWQGAVIAALVVKQAYVLAAPDFAFSLTALAWSLGEIVVGVAMIVLVKRERQDRPAPLAAPGAPRPALSIAAAIGLVLLGIVVGGALGLGLGIGGGQIYASATDMSCFEGGCGYFVIFMGLAGTIVGALAGGIFTLWRVLSRRSGQPA
ncbi:hypothetical protein [Aminobacter sp. BE322]|uniref:hypothetical protein n=1 Tax=unclassified Aminobacter TaxID=2644704 RepID=UPI003D1F2E60